MPDINIGSYDKSMWTSEKPLSTSNTAIKKGLTAQDAEKLAKTTSGSEVIVKEKDGTYSVYKLQSEDAIENADFKNEDIKVKDNIASLYGGTKAYIATSDNAIRSLEIEGIELESLDQDFITADLDIKIKDKDGIDTNSKGDMEGTISGTISVKKEMLDYSVAMANKELPVSLALTNKPGSQSYEVNLSYGVLSLGKVTLTMDKDGINAKIETKGLPALVSEGVKFSTNGVLDVEALAVDFVKNKLAADFGLKATELRPNELRLEPDFVNSRAVKPEKLSEFVTKFNSNNANTGTLNFSHKAGSQDYSLGYNLFNTKLGTINLQTNPQSDIIKGKIDILPQLSKYNAQMQAPIENLAKEMGLTLEFTNTAKTEFILKPNKFIKSIPVGDMKMNLEEVRTDSNNTNFRIDRNGDLQISLKSVTVIGSSNENANKFTTADKEGPDELDVKVNMNLHNDLTSKVSADADLKINITPQEAAGMQTRLKNLTGQDVSMSGKIEVYDVGTTVLLDAKGKPIDMLNVPGKIKINELNTTFSGNTLKIKAGSGDLNYEEQETTVNKVKKTNMLLHANDVSLTGSLETATTNIKFKELKLTQTLVYDKTNPNRLEFAGGPDSKLKLTADIIDRKTKETIAINGLNLQNAQTVIDTQNGKISISPDKDNNMLLSVYRLTMPSTKLSNLAFKGKMDIDTQSGAVVLEGQRITLKGQISDIKINNLSASGKFTYDPSTGIKLERLNLKASGKIGDFDISSLKGKGTVAFDTGGNLLLTDAADLQLESSTGIKAKGDLKVGYKNGIYTFSATSNKPVNFGYSESPDSFAVKDLIIKGSVNLDEKTGKLSFNGKDDNVEIKQGNIEGIDVKNVKLNGELDITSSVITLNNSRGPVNLSGNIAGIEIQDLKSTGQVKFDTNASLLSWDKDLSVSLPEQKLNLTTSGNLSLKFGDNGKVILTSKDGVINGSIGDVNFKDFKIQGKLVYDPKTSNITMEGLTDSTLAVSGKINDKQLDLKTTGAVNFTQNGKALNFSGQNIKLEGKIGGFDLQTLTPINADVSVSENNEIDVSKLNFNLDVDGIGISNNDGSFKETQNGYEVKLSGNANADQSEIVKFLSKLSSGPTISKAGQNNIKDIISNINAYLADTKLNNATYDNLNIKFDKEFNLIDFSVQAKGSTQDTVFKIDIGDKKKPEVVNMNLGQVNFTMNASNTSTAFQIKDGNINFKLTEDLRNTIKTEVTKKLEEQGLKDIDLQVLENGQIKLKNATYEVYSSKLDKLGAKIEKLNIPVISDVIGKSLRLTDISADFGISTKVENNKLVVSIDEVGINQFFLRLLQKGTEATGIVNLQNQGAKLAVGKINTYFADPNAKDSPKSEVAERVKKNIFTLDLQKLAKQASADLELKDVNISQDGLININFDYTDK